MTVASHLYVYIAKCQIWLEEVTQVTFPRKLLGTFSPLVQQVPHTKQLCLPTVCIQPSGTSLVHEDLRNLYRNMRAMHSFKTVVKCRNQSYCCDIK